MNTLPFRFSFPFESTERPRLKMDLHFFDFPDNFLLIEKKKDLYISNLCHSSWPLCARRPFLTCCPRRWLCGRGWRCWCLADCSPADALYARGGLGSRSGPGPPPGSSASSVHTERLWEAWRTSPHTSEQHLREEKLCFSFKWWIIAFFECLFYLLWVWSEQNPCWRSALCDSG